MAHEHNSRSTDASPAPRARVQPRHVYLRRRAVALAIVALVVLAVAAMCARPDPVPEAAPAEPAEPTAPVDVVQEITPKRIEQSRPVTLEVPRIGLRADFEPGDCRVKDGAINPATMDLACAYTAPDRTYQLPGSDAGDVVVTAGHAGAGRPGVFDALYDASRDAHTVQLGDVLYLHTEASGSEWLKYVATDLHDPSKDALSQDLAIWGTGATPGRLLTISCIQPLLSDAVRNAVVGWQFEGVETRQG